MPVAVDAPFKSPFIMITLFLPRMSIRILGFRATGGWHNDPHIQTWPTSSPHGLSSPSEANRWTENKYLHNNSAKQFGLSTRLTKRLWSDSPKPLIAPLTFTLQWAKGLRGECRDKNNSRYDRSLPLALGENGLTLNLLSFPSYAPFPLVGVGQGALSWRGYFPISESV